MKIKEKVLKEHKYSGDLSWEEEIDLIIDKTLAEVGKVVIGLDKIQDKGSDWDIGHHEALEKLKQKLGIK